MTKLFLKSLLMLTLIVAGVGEAKAGKHNLTFKTDDYCSAQWNANNNTFTWGSGGWGNPEWVFMTAESVSGDLSSWVLLHLHVSDWSNASNKQLRVVFKKNDSSWPPSGPTKEFVVSPDASGDIYLSLKDINWSDCDITNIQDLTIYGCDRDNTAIDASVKITDAYYIDEVQPLTFKTEEYCAAQWNASTNTFTWGAGGWNPEWVFMAADGISGDLSNWTLLHLHVSDFTNASANELKVVFKKNDGSNPPSGPTKEFVVSPNASGDIFLSLEDVNWGNCDITNIQDLTIYGCSRDDNTKNASVKVTDAYYVTNSESTGLQPVNQSINITVGNKTRSYWLYVPNGCKTNAPLVIAMHGAGGTSSGQTPHFNEIADTAKFIIAYPQGEQIYFPVFGGTVTGWDASGEENSDVTFIKAIVDELAQNYQIDRKRVYCCGFSNGGMNTYALANACSDVFAAYASISGFPLNEFHLRHVSKRPVPFLHIHGKNDDFVKYSLMHTIVDEMVARMGANPVPVKPRVSGKYDKSVYEAIDGSFPYIYYEIDGMGHNDFTTNTEDGNSSLTMWKFFRQYSLDSPCDNTLKWMPRVETANFNPAAHGWTVNSGTTVLAFGLGAKTDANQNVYPSLQLTSGHYKLSFHADGEAGKTVGVKLVRYGNASVVFNKTVTVGKDVTLYFDIENDAFGQYKITFTRQSASDNISISNIILTTTEVPSLSLDTNTDNTDILKDNLADKVNVTINGRKLHKDGYWNPLCLPFDVTVSESVLNGAIVKTLESSLFDEGTLTLNFTEGNLSKIEAGKPYIIMWESGDDIEDPVFEGVTISNNTTAVETSYVNFMGSFAPAVYNEATNNVLYLSEANTPYYPAESMTIGAFHTRFDLLNDLIAGESASQSSIRSFVLNFNDESTSVKNIPQSSIDNSAIWDLSGRNVGTDTKVLRPGIYVRGGKKIRIK